MEAQIREQEMIEAEQRRKAEAAAEKERTARPYLKSGELNTGLSDVLPITKHAVSAKDTTSPEAKNSTQNSFLKPDDLDIDISENVVPPQHNDSKENS